MYRNVHFFSRRSPFPDHTRSDATVSSVCPVQRSVISGFFSLMVLMFVKCERLSLCFERWTVCDTRAPGSTSTKPWPPRRSSRCPARIPSSRRSGWVGNSKSSVRYSRPSLLPLSHLSSPSELLTIKEPLLLLRWRMSSDRSTRSCRSNASALPKTSWTRPGVPESWKPY